MLSRTTCDEDNTSKTEKRKPGIRDSSGSGPGTHIELPFSARIDIRFLQSEINSFAESDVWNVGNTRPPQHLQPFTGNDTERTYLIYFVTGDMYAYWHGTKVRVEGGTTHLAQLELLRELFGAYAKPIITPTLLPTGQYGLRATFDLHRSFYFLIGKAHEILPEILHNDRLFYGALSGFADAEGHVGLKMSDRKAYAHFTLNNRDHRIMRDFLRGLRLRGDSANMYALNSPEVKWQLELFGISALNLLKSVTFRHREKIIGKQIASKHNAQPWSFAGPIYLAHRGAIRLERDLLGVVAEHRYRLREKRKQQKMEIWRSKVEAAFPLIAQGLRMDDVARKLNCSLRTAYRRKEKFREIMKSKNP